MPRADGSAGLTFSSDRIEEVEGSGTGESSRDRELHVPL